MEFISAVIRSFKSSKVCGCGLWFHKKKLTGDKSGLRGGHICPPMCSDPDKKSCWNQQNRSSISSSAVNYIMISQYVAAVIIVSRNFLWMKTSLFSGPYSVIIRSSVSGEMNPVLIRKEGDIQNIKPSKPLTKMEMPWHIGTLQCLQHGYAVTGYCFIARRTLLEDTRHSMKSFYGWTSMVLL